jgi:hypothetical protein
VAATSRSPADEGSCATHTEDLDVPDATGVVVDAGFGRADLTAFCRLDELGLEVTEQRLECDRAVLEPVLLVAGITAGSFDRETGGTATPTSARSATVSPDDGLRRAREWIARAHEHADRGTERDKAVEAMVLAGEGFEVLDAYICRGGGLPTEWRQIGG